MRKMGGVRIAMVLSLIPSTLSGWEAAGPVQASGPASAAPPLGSSGFRPSRTRPVGWRGDGSGRFPSADPDIRWSTGENVLWKTEVGAGHSSPLLVGRRLLITSDPDGREGKWEVAYKRSADGGDTWGPERWLTPGVDLFRLGTAVCLRAGAVLGSTLHVVWGSKTLVTPTPAGIHTWGKICYQRSTDGGATWGEPRRITAVNAPNGWATHAKICASGATVQLAWTVAPDGQDQPRAAFYLNSPDGGLSWGAPERLTSATDGECWVEAVGGTESYAVVLIRKDDKLYWRRRDLDADEGGRR